MPRGIQVTHETGYFNKPWIQSILAAFDPKSHITTFQPDHAVAQIINVKEISPSSSGEEDGGMYGSAELHDGYVRASAVFTSQAVERFETEEEYHSGCEFGHLPNCIVTLKEFTVVPRLAEALDDCRFDLCIQSFVYWSNESPACDYHRLTRVKACPSVSANLAKLWRRTYGNSNSENTFDLTNSDLTSCDLSELLVAVKEGSQGSQSLMAVTQTPSSYPPSQAEAQSSNQEDKTNQHAGHPERRQTQPNPTGPESPGKENHQPGAVAAPKLTWETVDRLSSWVFKIPISDETSPFFCPERDDKTKLMAAVVRKVVACVQTLSQEEGEMEEEVEEERRTDRVLYDRLRREMPTTAVVTLAPGDMEPLPAEYGTDVYDDAEFPPSFSDSDPVPVLHCWSEAGFEEHENSEQSTKSNTSMNKTSDCDVTPVLFSSGESSKTRDPVQDSVVNLPTEESIGAKDEDIEAKDCKTPGSTDKAQGMEEEPMYTDSEQESQDSIAINVEALTFPISSNEERGRVSDSDAESTPKFTRIRVVSSTTSSDRYTVKEIQGSGLSTGENCSLLALSSSGSLGFALPSGALTLSGISAQSQPSVPSTQSVSHIDGSTTATSSSHVIPTVLQGTSSWVETSRAVRDSDPLESTLQPLLPSQPLGCETDAVRTKVSPPMECAILPMSPIKPDRQMESPEAMTEHSQVSSNVLPRSSMELSPQVVQSGILEEPPISQFSYPQVVNTGTIEKPPLPQDSISQVVKNSDTVEEAPVSQFIHEPQLPVSIPGAVNADIEKVPLSVYSIPPVVNSGPVEALPFSRLSSSQLVDSGSIQECSLSQFSLPQIGCSASQLTEDSCSLTSILQPTSISSKQVISATLQATGQQSSLCQSSVQDANEAGKKEHVSLPPNSPAISQTKGLNQGKTSRSPKGPSPVKAVVPPSELELTVPGPKEHISNGVGSPILSAMDQYIPTDLMLSLTSTKPSVDQFSKLPSTSVLLRHDTSDTSATEDSEKVLILQTSGKDATATDNSDTVSEELTRDLSQGPHNVLKDAPASVVMVSEEESSRGVGDGQVNKAEGTVPKRARHHHQGSAQMTERGKKKRKRRVSGPWLSKRQKAAETEANPEPEYMLPGTHLPSSCETSPLSSEEALIEWSVNYLLEQERTSLT